MIEFQNVTKIYKGNKKAVSDISLSFDDSEFICFIGTSGSGKTTAMRMINRMIEPSSGNILIDGKNIRDINPVELRRSVGYVIQNIGLLPHMTIRDNITLVPKLLKWPEQERKEIAEQMIRLVELPVDMLDRYPHELSGGQQQRIGVVRALAADQNIVLMDEPFGALDPITRDALQDFVKELQEKMGKTIVFVTHDMDEALKLATKIVIMSHGKVVQCDTPENILKNPANEFVRELIGEERLIHSQQDYITVGEVVNQQAISITPDKSVSEAIRLMREKRVDTLLVVDKQNVLRGFIDVEMINNQRGRTTIVGDILNSDVFFIRDTALLRNAIQKILKRGLKYVPVVDKDKKLIGIITRSSLVDMVYETIWGEEDPLAATAVESPVLEQEEL
ncbi:betaine/proline/choline family ABC transporter ATP-binding protein [Vagococcus fluvialis]|jgi:osmoprotectant transport system ATP-binding protein|uniref:Quaternary amine transport ATP-binding protein n=1 Tax=Vagococcus fluvialis TaxID=2738 RepID=A0A369AZY9_9ENTE|nr:betaine/proline/choline family ABC transporter ATP-binding protein [Vagococcus fluvialis]MDR2278523.1 betaine/proline/choline family ABC transporter ATP-binding protein [Vagococcus sp.]OTP33963.1 glycine betaine/carnitine/choline ABC transporter ATP-binding protein [Enterococcus sp. 6C8_DIV0013]MBO0419619.1 betaine/proline/choline family ABC transporter ATP-binding protein [Vagococcus fluvialis]MBO0437801.1 betaine/proline/choline family ABC transporter ATP-binding protein [Vagococcus fluvia